MRFASCPARLIVGDVRAMHDSYARYVAAGVLPAEGGTLDQSAACLAAFDLLASCYASLERREMDEARKG